MAGIEPAASAWKAEVLPLYDIRVAQNICDKSKTYSTNIEYKIGGGGRIRTSEAYAPDLQSSPFDRSGTPPNLSGEF